MKCPKHKVGDREPPLEGPRLERSPGAGTPAPGGPGGGRSARVGPGPLIEPARAGGGASPGRGGAGRGDWPTGKAAGGASLWRSGRGRGRGAGLEELPARQVPRSQQLAARLFPAEAAIVIHPRPEEPPDPARPPARPPADAADAEERSRRRSPRAFALLPARVQSRSLIRNPDLGSGLLGRKLVVPGREENRFRIRLLPEPDGTGPSRPHPPARLGEGEPAERPDSLEHPGSGVGGRPLAWGYASPPGSFKTTWHTFYVGRVVARSWAPWEWGGVRRGRGWLLSRTCLLERGWGRGEPKPVRRRRCRRLCALPSQPWPKPSCGSGGPGAWGPCSGDAGSPGVGRTGSRWLLLVSLPVRPVPGAQPGSAKLKVATRVHPRQTHDRPSARPPSPGAAAPLARERRQR